MEMALVALRCICCGRPVQAYLAEQGEMTTSLDQL